jgi:hypothetical protein
MAYGAPTSGYANAAPVDVSINYKKYDWELLAMGAAAAAVLWYINR